MMRKYQLTEGERCRKSGILVRSFPDEYGIYTLDLQKSNPTSNLLPPNSRIVTYTGAATVIIPASLSRKLSKRMGGEREFAKRIYIEWDGETFHIMNPECCTKAMLDNGYEVKSKGHLDGMEEYYRQDWCEFLVNNEIFLDPEQRLIYFMPGEVFIHENGGKKFKNVPCDDENFPEGIFIRIIEGNERDPFIAFRDKSIIENYLPQIDFEE